MVEREESLKNQIHSLKSALRNAKENLEGSRTEEFSQENSFLRVKSIQNAYELVKDMKGLYEEICQKSGILPEYSKEQKENIEICNKIYSAMRTVRTHQEPVSEDIVRGFQR